MGCAAVYKSVGLESASQSFPACSMSHICDHAPLIRFVIRPAGHGAITRAAECGFMNQIRSSLHTGCVQKIPVKYHGTVHGMLILPIILIRNGKISGYNFIQSWFTLLSIHASDKTAAQPRFRSRISSLLIHAHVRQ